jgi:hypothetical protein
MEPAKLPLLAVLFLAIASGQPSVDPADPTPRRESKRIFLIVPNNRAAPSFKDFKPIRPREKFGIATRDAFDPGTFALAAAFGAQSQITSASPSFGTGASAYGHYFATQYADLFIGDYFTEAVFPTLFRQDPRYFRSSETGKWKRFRYAATRVFITYSDQGKKQFNISEVVGNSAAVAISSAYYPDRRNAADAGAKLATQLAVDVVSDLMKEYWPEISRKFTRKPKH